MAQKQPVTETPPPSTPQKTRSTRTRFLRAARATLLGLTVAMNGCATMKKSVNWIAEEEIFDVQEGETQTRNEKTPVDTWIERNAEHFGRYLEKSTLEHLGSFTIHNRFERKALYVAIDRYYGLEPGNQVNWLFRDLIYAQGELQKLQDLQETREGYETLNPLELAHLRGLAKKGEEARQHESHAIDLERRLAVATRAYSTETARLNQQLRIARAENRRFRATTDTIRINLNEATNPQDYQSVLREGEITIRLGDKYFALPDATHVCSEDKQTCLRLTDIIEKGYEVLADTTKQHQPL